MRPAGSMAARVGPILVCSALGSLLSCTEPSDDGAADTAKTQVPPAQSAAQLSLDRLFADPPLDGVRLQSLQWTEDGSRLGFLRPRRENSDELGLWVYEVATGRSRLLVRARDLVSAEKMVLSEAQIAELERKRITQRGITSFICSPDSTSILIPLGADLYRYELETSKAAPVFQGGQQAPLDTRFSPDGQRISFVRGGEIWIVERSGGKPRQLTSGASATRKHGLAEFVAQEEMGRHRGYWWSPDSRRIAYLEVDESEVAVWRRASYRGSVASLVEQRYPAAGEANAKVRLGLLELDSGETRWLELDDDVEYIARVDWGPAGGSLFLQVQSRDQRRLRLLRVDPASLAARALIEERADTFINLHDDLRVLDDGGFLWSSEAGGTRQLFLHDREGKRIRRLSSQASPIVAVEGLDRQSGTVLYTASTNRGLEKHLFRVSLEGGEPERLTSEPGWHNVEVSKAGRRFADVHSSRLSPPRVILRDASGKELAVIEANPTEELDRLLRARPEFLELNAADGRTSLNASLLKPPDFDPANKYPVVVYGYGGPHGHVVADAWHRSLPFDHLLAQRGFMVLRVDPRGSAHRGKTFEDEIHERFGAVEVEDHRAAVEQLKRRPGVDPERIAVWGWSYGGTLVLMSLLSTEAVYRCGVAVAPVTDWRWYDTHYTERYLGTPRENADLYRTASPLYREPTGITESLLLIHGMADDNVFVRHSLAFIERLQAAGIQFELMLYPDKTHYIAGKKTRRHLYELILRFFKSQLQPN